MNDENIERYEMYAEGFSQIPRLHRFEEITNPVTYLRGYVPITKLGKNKSMEDST
ncbi:hypothetical protein HYT25_03740 [Candidatus Pacearchaeota archaeon]|nr:hypothetical protein [Candidatus Pacearchaeota archaeon]